MPGDCQQVLVDLKRRGDSRGLSARRGPDVPWFEQPSDAPAWLAQLTGLQHNAAAVESDRWAMFRGDASRNASSPRAAPRC